jgi:hypothetical protein
LNADLLITKNLDLFPTVKYKWEIRTHSNSNSNDGWGDNGTTGSITKSFNVLLYNSKYDVKVIVALDGISDTEELVKSQYTGYIRVGGDYLVPDSEIRSLIKKSMTSVESKGIESYEYNITTHRIHTICNHGFGLAIDGKAIEEGNWNNPGQMMEDDEGPYTSIVWAEDEGVGHRVGEINHNEQKKEYWSNTVGQFGNGNKAYYVGFTCVRDRKI